MRSTATRTSAASLWPATPARDAAAPAASSRSEQGRRAILLGWLTTMLGIVAYIVAMSRAGDTSGILDAITGQGPLGWTAAGLMIGGVVMWFIGNLACLKAMAEVPADDD